MLQKYNKVQTLAHTQRHNTSRTCSSNTFKKVFIIIGNKKPRKLCFLLKVIMLSINVPEESAEVHFTRTLKLTMKKKKVTFIFINLAIS